ncbi:major facilitator superfamily domain-containing protein [Chlamydoabsidia padenii]|nr:major facilitator superfamily domain-containing protein [Chlamydoabsidia padenii]
MEDANFTPSSSSILSTNENDPLITEGHDSDKKIKTKATAWHVIAPLFFLTFGVGALLAPMVQFYTSIFCNRYYETNTGNNSFLRSMVNGDLDDGIIDDSPLPDVKDCSIPEIQSVVSRVQAILLFLDAASSLLVASYYGSLSDRYGRRLVFRIFSIGGIVTMLCYIAVAKFQGLIGLILIIAAPLVHGFLAGDVIILAAVQSYISDCTTIETRTVAFGRMMASILGGIVIGPTVASILILETGTVVSVFYLVMVLFIGFYIYTTLFMPESLNEQSMKVARRNAAQQPKLKFWQKLNLLSSLSILIKAEPRHISRYAVPLLASIQFLLMVVSRPPYLLYAMLEFKWTAYEGGLLISVMSLMRFIVIIVLLPRLLLSLRDRWQNTTNGMENDEHKIHRRILFDTWMIRTGLAVETICFVLAALATTGRGFAWALILQSVAVLSQPSVRSLFTTLVDPSEIGTLFGAQAILDSIASK